MLTTQTSQELSFEADGLRFLLEDEKILQKNYEEKRDKPTITTGCFTLSVDNVLLIKIMELLMMVQFKQAFGKTQTMGL